MRSGARRRQFAGRAGCSYESVAAHNHTRGLKPDRHSRELPRQLSAGSYAPSNDCSYRGHVTSFDWSRSVSKRPSAPTASAAGKSALEQLSQAWLAEAEVLRRRGAATLADVLTACAQELKQAVFQRELELVNLEQASAESGFSYSALEKMVRSGRLPNAGQKGRPLVRRGDLPRKGHRPQTGPALADMRLASGDSGIA